MERLRLKKPLNFRIGRHLIFLVAPIGDQVPCCRNDRRGQTQIRHARYSYPSFPEKFRV
jgi:hypothetical protein